MNYNYVFSKHEQDVDVYYNFIFQREHYISQVNSDDLNRIKTLFDAIKDYTSLLKSYNRITCPIYYINMSHNKDRNEFMKNQLAHYSHNVTRIEGCNGSNIKDNKINGISFKNSKYQSIYECAPNEIGCFMSHILSIKKAYDNGDLIAMILEDDADLSLFNLNTPFDTFIKDAPSDWEMINLFHINKNVNLQKHVSPLGNTYLIHDSNDRGWSCVAYLINRKGMKRVLDKLTTTENGLTILVISPIDHALHDSVNTYYIERDIVIPNNLNLQSTIHDNHTGWHINTILYTLEQYSKQLNV